MKIAFISYEYPPDTAFGGIATYVYQMAQILHQRGHHVEVFTSSWQRNSSGPEQGILVHRICERDQLAFAERIALVFADRHQITRFDVLEGTEIGASARGAIQQVPDIPLVVKLHTPSFLINQINHIDPPFSLKLRRFLGALRRGQKPTPFPQWHYDIHQDLERWHTLQADEIITPSHQLGAKLIEQWHLPAERVVHLPNPYTPVADLLDIPVDTCTQRVTFIGRLEIRKGILELAQAIPQILRQFPQTKFRFVGAALPSPQPGLTMQEYLERQLWHWRQSLEFTGAIALDRIPDVLASTDICVFPSRWENFPNVCLEAMAAARGIVGSKAGGMADMLDGGQAGWLVPPCDSKVLATAIVSLLQDPELRMQLGKTARDRVLATYNQQQIGQLQEASYVRAIQRRQTIGLRTF